MDQNIDDISYEETIRLLLAYGPEAPIFNKDDVRNYGNNYTKMQYYWQNIRCLLSQGEFRYMVFYIAVSITGSFVAEMVYCFHLLDVV